MTLKSIEINAFKSFGKKSTVLFTAPIVSIVGPNGSGKSNIVEAMRFVLGEQSMKSLRGKGSADLIFKGSKGVSQASKASVSIIFDNSKKVFSFSSGSQDGYKVSLDYDEITISREVFQDGSSRYSINNTEVRLKDIIDLLSSVNIGSSGHHIISQGEADRILSASLKDRKAMIEDALGLKIYQFRIKESERKLEKTLTNIKEVSSLRREIAPHLSFLKKQVEKIEKVQELREDLRNLYKNYLSRESFYITSETKRISQNKNLINEKISNFEIKIKEIESGKEKENQESEYLKEIKKLEEELTKIRVFKDELARKLGRIEGIIEELEKGSSNKVYSKNIISETEWKDFIEEIDLEISKALEIENLPSILNVLKSIKVKINKLKDRSGSEENKKDEKTDKNKEMIEAKEHLTFEIEKIEENEENIKIKIADLRQRESESQSALRDNERVLYEILNQKNSAVSEMHSINFEEEKLELIKNAFEIEVNEAKILIGQEIFDYLNLVPDLSPEEITRQLQVETQRKIERIKIKLEDSGIGNSSDVIKEYEDTKERDLFLSNQLEDLNKSIDSLRILIQELRDNLEKEFKNGVDKINKQFQEFFTLMFGGGSAFLTITTEIKKQKEDELSEETEEFSEEEDDDLEKTPEKGIEINVNLPQKKVKDLHMLSGGERSLVSIALLFAISQVNPPPFLVLDETDAALDEANSRKYGSMLENLSKYSQLIIVTHNRETMSRANILYGVTMGSDGTSKLLSIKLEDATTYAK